MRQLFIIGLLLLSTLPMPISSSSPQHGSLILEQEQSVEMINFQSALNSSLLSKPITDEFRTEYPVEGVEGIFDVFVARDNLVWFSVLYDSQLWVLNRSSSLIQSFILPINVTPFLIKEDDDGILWFSDYDFSPFNHYDGIIRFDPTSLNGTVYQLNIPKTGPFDLLLTGGKVWFTQWMTGIAALLDPESGMISTVKFDNTRYSDFPCGPVGMSMTQNGKIWVVETLCSILVEMDPLDMSYTLHKLPSDFYSPVFLAEDPDGNLWTGDHAGNRILKFYPETGEYETVLVVPPKGGVWGFAGINEVQLDSNGKLWFAEHFINRVGYYDTKTKHMVEFILPQPDPLIQWIDLNGTDLWYGIYTEGSLGLIEGDLIPEVDIQLESTEYSVSRVGNFKVSMQVTVSEKLSGKTAKSYAVSENSDQIFGLSSQTVTMSESFESSIVVNIGNNIELGRYHALVGLELQGMLVSRQLTIDIRENLFFTVFVQGLGPIILIYLVGFIKRERGKSRG